jgi:hypothetical protein
MYASSGTIQSAPLLIQTPPIRCMVSSNQQQQQQQHCVQSSIHDGILSWRLGTNGSVMFGNACVHNSTSLLDTFGNR